MKLRVLYEDSNLIAIDKPARIHSCAPEDPRFSRIPKSQDAMKLLRDQLNTWVYPLHRLDRATSGVLLFAKNQAAAREYQALFTEGLLSKQYSCVVRGWSEAQGEITQELENGKPASTKYETLARVELPFPNKRHSSSRFSFLRVTLDSGRRHQIRKHLRGISHPVIGDREHGDPVQNQIFEKDLGLPGLWLRACSLQTDGRLGSFQIRTRFPGNWHRVFDLFGICPWWPKNSEPEGCTTGKESDLQFEELPE
jgi:tRNA pseudouridine65 synthase